MCARLFQQTIPTNKKLLYPYQLFVKVYVRVGREYIRVKMYVQELEIIALYVCMFVSVSVYVRARVCVCVDACAYPYIHSHS